MCANYLQKESFLSDVLNFSDGVLENLKINKKVNISMFQLETQVKKFGR